MVRALAVRLTLGASVVLGPVVCCLFCLSLGPGARGMENAKITVERVEVWAGQCRLRHFPAQYSQVLGSLGSGRFRRQEGLRTGSLLRAITLRWLLNECVDGFPRSSLELGEG